MSKLLNESEYIELYELLKSAFTYAGRNRYGALIRAQRTLAYKYGKRYRVPRNKLYSLIRDARRASGNPALSKLSGVIIVNDIFDMIDNISGTKPADVESAMHELRDTIRNMNRLNDAAKVVSDKCEVIAGNLDSIRQYMEGEVEELKINAGKHTAPAKYAL